MPLIRQKRKGNVTKSGAITIQPKAQLKEKDSLQGTVPVDLSINGHELTNTNISFSDNIKNYVFGQSYPLTNISEGLPSSDNFYGSMISSPNSVGTVFSKNSSISQKFLKDERQKERLTIDFRPYKEENQITIDRTSEFYASGTSPLVSANFQQSLASRETISIPIVGSIPFDVSGEGEPENGLGVSSPFFTLNSYPDGLDGTKGAVSSIYYNHDDTSLPLTNNVDVGEAHLNFFSYYNFKEGTWSNFKGYIANNENRVANQISDLVFNKSTFMQNLDKMSMPFTPSTWSRKNNQTNHVSGSLSSPMSNFGFPFSEKFKPLEDNLLKMSNYIDKPFFLEKIILKINFSHKSKITRLFNNASQEFPIPFTTGINIFLLNNKKVNSKRRVNYNIENDTTLTKTVTKSGTSLVTNNEDYCNQKDVDSYRELITYGKIFITTTGSYTSSSNLNTTTLENIRSQADDYYYIETSPFVDKNSGFMALEMEKSDIEAEFEIPIRTAFKDNITSYIPIETTDLQGTHDGVIFVGNPHGENSLLGNSLNKSYIKNNQNYSNIIKSETGLWTFDIGASSLYLLGDKINLYENDSRSVPYILYPEDEIVLGVSSFNNFFFDNNYFSNTFIRPGSTLILVGTPINNDRPKFEFDKRFLTSKSIRTGISGDKHFTDKFDTLPIQFYASSSIDKIVESTGNEKIDRAVTGYYSDGNRGTHLKAVELQNSDVSLTGSLLSEKMHFNYSSYGNFSDIYKQRPYTSYFSVGNNVVNHAIEKIFYNQDTGELAPQEDILSFNNSSYSAIERPYKEE